MYRFNVQTGTEEYQVIIEFKYNPCIGSIVFKGGNFNFNAYLNTTHVSVQYRYLQFASAKCKQFKYNPCIGSILHLKR